MARRKTSFDPLFDEPQGPNWGRYALIAAIVIIVGFVLYAALGGSRDAQGPVPLIRADETPWTRAPSEAGGMEIPNQDSTVFELMDKEGEKEVEADTETATEEEKEDVKLEEKAGSETEETKEVAKEEAQKDAKPTLDDLVDEAMETPKAEEKEVIGADKETPKKEEEPAPIKKDMVRVRLGAVPGTDTSEAKAEFNRLKGLAGGQLTGTPSFETVNLPKGSFVRINVPMERMDAARLCDTLSAKGAPCLILSE